MSPPCTSDPRSRGHPDGDRPRVRILQDMALNRRFNGELSGREPDAAIGDKGAVAAALVMYDEPTETIAQYAPYVLKANGGTQPGG